MVFYKEAKFFNDNNDVRFDETRACGERALYDGIYRCTACNAEKLVRADEMLPACEGEHDHAPKWRLICAPE